MDDALSLLLATHRGVAGTRDLGVLGLGSEAVRDLVARGRLVRLRRGTFVDGELWRAAPPWDRHHLRARAVARERAGAAVALSHHSALAVQGIGVHGVDERVHLVRTVPGRSRADRTVVVHQQVPPPFLADREGTRCVVPAMACLQVAARFGVEAGLVSADAALHTGVIDRTALHAAAAALGPVTGRGRALRMVELASARSESAGESRCRWVFVLVGLPDPEQQVEIRDAAGAFVARVDFLFRHAGVVVEFDGMLKYGDGSALRAEKVREDRLRELGYEVVRLTWADLASGATVAGKLHAAFARAAARPGARGRALAGPAS